MKKDINFSLVEETRPPIYTAMKYWGKKPHNIWRKYIDTYTPKNGLYLDPFAGSAMSAFEAVKVGKKAIAFDLNPMTSFIIEVFATKFDKDKFTNEVKNIVNDVEADKIYNEYFSTECRHCHSKEAITQHYKWDKNNIYEIGIICNKCGQGKKYLAKPNSDDIKKAEAMDKIKINDWYPNKTFYNSPSFNPSLIKNIGGNNFSNLWTKRNLYILSQIFNKISNIEEKDLKKQLLFAFTQAIHLCTKMSVPRREGAKRPFSTSWGRSAYICSSRQMEMNPLFVFISSSFGKQSVESSLSNVQEYLGKIPKILYVDESNRSIRTKNFDIKYGIIDINIIQDYIDENTIDFILTDPPYGGLVQYLDLSSLWLIWLEHIDRRFSPNYDAEITIKKGVQEIDIYKAKFANGIKNLYKILKPNGKIVFTFHNKDIKIWNAFLNSLFQAGFKIEKVIHQQNRRTGESNVANPYGTSATDFYIRCIKANSLGFKSNEERFSHFVLDTAIRLIALRNEPTPYQILFNGILAELSNEGYGLDDFDQNIESILSKEIDKIFKLTENDKNNGGTYWWFVNPSKYIKYPDLPLTDRVEDTIKRLLRRKMSVKFDEVLAEIFIKYPNGLTPNIKSISSIIMKYAYKSGGNWIYKGGQVEKDFTEHTRFIYLLSKVGKKMGYKIFVGRREQSENYEGKKLIQLSDFDQLNSIISDEQKRKRVEMIDLVWVFHNKIIAIFEIENSTNFTSGIQRGSNLNTDINKFMIVPDIRNKKFINIKDPLFVQAFKSHNWKYLNYSDVEKLIKNNKLNIDTIIEYSKGLIDE
jgi:16S rRNA G966 N2-methylase RsmD